MKLDLGFSVIGSNSKDVRYIHITRKDVLKRVDNHPAIDEWTKEYLFEKIEQYPDDALVYFVKNINQIVIAALNERTKVLKEQNGTPDESIDPPASISSGESGERVSKPKAKKEREDLFSKRPLS